VPLDQLDLPVVVLQEQLDQLDQQEFQEQQVFKELLVLREQELDQDPTYT